jgi:FRG domain
MSSAWSNILSTIAQRQNTARDDGLRVWFRGHRSVEWALTSRLHRYVLDAFRAFGQPIPENDKVDLLRNEEKSLYRMFRERATSLMDPVSSSPWATLFAMQHYGWPTRLLDWTESFACALYFANRGRKEGEDAAVFLMAPEGLNQKIAGIDGLVSIEDEGIPGTLDLRRYHPHFVRVLADRPSDVAVAPMFFNSRMRAQRCGFVFTGDSFIPLDRPEVLQMGVIQKLILPKETFTESADWLRLAGVDHFGLFPDWEGLRWEFEERQAHLLRWANAQRIERGRKFESEMGL